MNENEIRFVSKEPLVLLLKLPDGCTPGRWEAAEAFAETISEVHKRFCGMRFQFLPFTYDTPSDGTNPALSAMLAVVG